jgi:hypothetical protein
VAKLDQFMKGLGKGEVLVPHLNKWFRQDFTGYPDIPLSVQMYKQPDNAFHPSSHATGCTRLLYASFDPELDREKSGPDPKVGANGHMWHGLIQHIVADLGLASVDDMEARYGVLQPMDDDLGRENWSYSHEPPNAAWWATGAIDIANLRVPGRDETYLVDIKTMNPHQFKQPKPSEWLWQKYVAQCQLYLDWTDLETCIILGVEGANPFNFKEIQIKRDRDHVEYIYEKWNVVSEALLKGTPPPHSCINPKECGSLSLYG